MDPDATLELARSTAAAHNPDVPPGDDVDNDAAAAESLACYRCLDAWLALGGHQPEWKRPS